MNKYHNTWTDGSDNTITSETRPGEYWYPRYSPRRVSGSTYLPYSCKSGGSKEWTYAVNRLMARQAEANFQRSQMS